MPVALVSRPPTVAELRRLATAVGWEDHFDWATIGGSLAGSLHGVVAVVDGAAVGCGRVVGDGNHYFYLQDVLVHPDRQDEGIAARIVESLLEWVREHAASRAFIGLFASDEAFELYEGFGFGTDSMTGMQMRVDRAAES